MSRTLGFYSVFVRGRSLGNYLYQPFRLLASGGPTFGRPKVGRKTAGETPDPHFCPIGRHQGRCTVATEFLRGRWPLVISAVGYALRLTALGLRAAALYFCGKILYK